jgi:hypothetical protein
MGDLASTHGFIPDDWPPPHLYQETPASPFLRPPALFDGLIDVALNTKPVEPRLEVRKMTAYVEVLRELIEAPTPEEAAEAEVRRAAYMERKRAEHAAAVAEWEALREHYAHSPAVLAVLDIHHPDDEGRMECAHLTFGWESDAEDWPCSTYTAIKEATT